MVFYVSCAALTWFVYTRRGGALYETERKRAPVSAAPAGSAA
jgi:NNP family nitrate/nitrite transporter-like MFS transporter